jgi:hypothetical protein
VAGSISLRPWMNLAGRTVLCGAAFLVSVAMAHAIQLVTEEEAALPDDKLPPLVRRGPTRRPDILVVSPAPGAGLVRSPLILKIKFKPYGGAQIDSDTILVTYKKIPAIDMTQRMRPFISADGIEIVDAELPPGIHHFWIEAKDRDGRAGSAEFTIRVAR